MALAGFERLFREADGLGEPVAVHAETRVLQFVDHRLAGFVVKLDGHLAILPALKKMDTSTIIPGDLVGIGRSHPFICASDSFGKTRVLPVLLDWYCVIEIDEGGDCC